MRSRLVIKLGGALLSNVEGLGRLFNVLSFYYKNTDKHSIVLLHGGGYLVDDLLKKLAFPIKKKFGLRLTPFDQINFITGALAGTANKILLSTAKKNNISVVGLCLGDANIVKVVQRDLEFGHVGDVLPGDSRLLDILLNSGYMPILSSIGITEDGQLMNTNADYAAVALASVIHANLILLSDVSGVLDGKGNCIKKIDSEKAEELIKLGIITDGMIVKVRAALFASRSLNRSVYIASWRYPEELSDFLINGKEFGTKVLVDTNKFKE